MDIATGHNTRSLGTPNALRIIVSKGSKNSFGSELQLIYVF